MKQSCARSSTASPNRTRKAAAPSPSQLAVQDALILALHIRQRGQAQHTAIVTKRTDIFRAALAALPNLAEGLQVGGMCVGEAPHVHVPKRQLGGSLQRLRCPCNMSGDSTRWSLRQLAVQKQ